MGMSFGHLALLLIVVLVIFGAGRLPQVMGDLGKGLRAFKDGVKDSVEGSSLTQEKQDSSKASLSAPEYRAGQSEGLNLKDVASAKDPIGRSIDHV